MFSLTPEIIETDNITIATSSNWEYIGIQNRKIVISKIISVENDRVLYFGDTGIMCINCCLKIIYLNKHKHEKWCIVSYKNQQQADADFIKIHVELKSKGFTKYKNRLKRKCYKQ
jgi:hypothetical protein